MAYYSPAGLQIDHSQPHSNLEVAYDTTAPIPVLTQHDNREKIVAHTYSEQLYHDSHVLNPSAPYHPSELQPTTAARKRRICGLPLRTFVVALIVLVVVIAGAIAGGIAGAHANAQKTDDGDNVAAASPKTTESVATQLLTTTITTEPSTKSTPSPAPSVTKTRVQGPKPSDVLERDCPSSNNTVYNGMQSTLFQFRKLCGNQFVGYGDDVVNTQVLSLDECIDECARWNIANKAEIRAGRANMCGRVCFRSNWDNDWPRQCFGTPIQNTTEGAWRVGTDWNDDCDSAAWMNPYTL